MGLYLNSETAYTLYKSETKKPYFIDKTQMLVKLLPLVNQGNHYICLTRPRRFGKTMAAEALYSEYFGFTEEETDLLYERYLRQTEDPQVTREGLRIWYDGYCLKSGIRVYNPRSVVASLINNNLGNYWTSSGPYDEIVYYIEKNADAVKDDLALMVSGTPVAANIREYTATSMNLSTKDEIFSAMVVYGFLNYENGYVSIPNKELMNQFNETLIKESTLGYVYRLSSNSERMLKATKSGDVAVCPSS